MIAVRQKERPSVGLVFGGEDAIGSRGGARSVRIDTPHRAAGVWRINNHVALSPAPTARRAHFGKRLRRATVDRFLQFAAGENPR